MVANGDDNTQQQRRYPDILEILSTATYQFPQGSQSAEVLIGNISNISIILVEEG